MNQLREGLSQNWLRIQGSLFPWLQEELGPLTIKQQQLVTTLELIRIEEHLSSYHGGVGRPRKDRAAIARAFVAKMVYTIPCTSMLLERLKSDKSLRRICGWEYQHQVPSESVFSRVHAEFTVSRLPERVHAAIIQSSYEKEVVGHISRDSTAINAREKPLKMVKTKSTPKKRGRPKRGEESPKTMTRLERQASGIPLEVMLNELPKACDVGTKRNSKGYKTSWIGYKLHIDTADGGIPISCLLSSASMHDSQAAIPLAEITHGRICNLYDLMDSAYDAPQIHEHSRKLGHVPIIDINPRRNIELKQMLAAENKACKTVNHQTAEALRYNERSTVERVNGRLKDEFGGRYVRVRGHAKVMCHLMFGILALTADQLMRMIQ